MIFEFDKVELKPVPATTYQNEGILERNHLQKVLRTQLDRIIPNTMVIAEEFSKWEDSRRRIDLLGLDSHANLVVIELKRTEDGGHMELQAMRYAAMVSSMTFEQVVSTHSDFLSRFDEKIDAEENILKFLEWDSPVEDRFNQEVRIVLLSENFSKEITTTVLWLIDHRVDIRCFSIEPYKLEDHLLIDVQQKIPLPEATDYQVQIIEKRQKERVSRELGSVVDSATVEMDDSTYKLERYENQTILVINLESGNQEIAKPILRRIVEEKGLHIDTYLSSGAEKNTRALGRQIIKALNSITPTVFD